MLRPRVCRFYKRPGGCRQGDRCNFLHENTSNHNTTNTSSVSLPNQPVPRGICSDFWTKGHCRFGFNCRFRHEKPIATTSGISEGVPTRSLPLSRVSSLTVSQVHNYMRNFLNDLFRFENVRDIYTFVALFLSATKDNNWSLDDGQSLLTCVASPGKNGLLRLGDVIRWPDVAINAANSPTHMSFQRGYLPLIMYFASDFVVKSTINHDVNSLYALIHNDIGAFCRTVIECMGQLVANKSFKDPNASVHPSYLTGDCIFAAICTILFEYVTRFRHAVLCCPDVVSLIRKLDEWLSAWITGINPHDPTFHDDWASQTPRDSRMFTTKYLKEQVGRLVSIADREEASAMQTSGSAIGTRPIHDQTSVAAVGFLHATFEGPGELREGGPRHDNDFPNIPQIRIAPTHEELMCSLPPYLPANIVDAPHHLPSGTMERLLDIQFRLLREELIAPLRTALQCVFRDLYAPKNSKTVLSAVLQKRGGRYVGDMNGNNKIMFNVYTNCIPSNLDFHLHKGAVADMELDTPPGSARTNKAASRVRFWEGRGGKRLMHGSLVALLWGNGITAKAYLGVVTSSLKDLASSSSDTAERIRIQVSFFDSEIQLRMVRDIGRTGKENRSTGLLIESPVIFETLRPFLRALCREPISLPFSKYLIPAKSLEGVSVDPPRYSITPGFAYDLSCLFKGGPSEPISLRVDSTLSVDTCREALRLSNSRLDPSQADALIDSLTREVSLIQGPPGTGKTYIGVELLRLLKKNNVGPILMIAFTNHALDHMLSAVVDSGITDRIVRLGSRSADEKISKFSLETLEMIQPSTSLDEALPFQYRSLKATQQLLKDLSSSIIQQRVDMGQVEDHLCQLYTTHYDSLLEPPVWVELLQTSPEPGWEVAGTNSLKNGSEYYGFWEEGQDLKYLATQRDSYQKLLKASTDAGRNRYSALEEEELDSATEHDIVDDVDAAISDPLDLGSAASWLRSWSLHNAPPSQEEKEILVKPTTTENGNENSVFRNELFGPGGLPELPLTDRSLQDLLASNTNMWKLSRPERLRLSQYWKTELRETIDEDEICELNRLLDVYEQQRIHINEIKDQMKLRLLKNIDIVGCTTTGAAKFTTLLKSFSPKVLLVEEAGQVLEAHVLGSLVPSVEHLVLIGDPLQLRPNLANYDLSIDSKRGRTLYRFDVSLMERLSTAGLCMSQLQIQRRMRPAIAQLIRQTLYPSLQDHPLTSEYPPVRGMSKNVFFMSHGHRETGGGEDSVSKHNAFEVQMAVALVMHLLRQGCYNGDGDIVILCAYLGQLAHMRDALAGKVVTLIDERDEALLAAQDDGEERKDSVPVERVAINKKVLLRTIDNFQGEEAKIVILSLVRNSGTGEDGQENPFLGTLQSAIGFLKSRNRTNVALSRAQHGLYIMGNEGDLCEKSPMWATILESLDNAGCVGTGFPIECHKHPDSRHNIRKPEMFSQVAPDGGCLEACAEPLGCGHVCPYKCHSDDENHLSISCRQHCLRQCPKGHPCDKLCSAPCGACVFPIENVTLFCGHVSSVPCHLTDDLSKFACSVQVEKSYPTCEHKKVVKCSQDITSSHCDEICDIYLICCGHKCQSSCAKCQSLNKSTPPDPQARILRTSHCSHPCRKTLFCGHHCKVPCSQDHQCTKRCMERCRKQCEHASCKKSCHVACAPCAEPCSWICPHRGKCPVPCGSMCSRLPCDERCSITLQCGHRCASLCGEPCAICVVCAPDNRKTDVVELIMQTTLAEIEPGDTLDSLILTLSCGHTFTVETLDGICELSALYERDEDEKWSGIEKQSTPGFKQAPSCPNCRAPIIIPRYGRAFKRSSLDAAELNVASDMSRSIAQIEGILLQFKGKKEEHPDGEQMKVLVKSHLLTKERQGKLLVDHQVQLNNSERARRPMPVNVFILKRKKNMHMVPVQIAEIWSTKMERLLEAYRGAVETAGQRPAHVTAYQNALSTLYQLELKGFAKLPAGQRPQNPEEEAIRKARLKVGRAPLRADKRFCVEAIWLSIQIRFKLAEFGESMLKSINKAGSPSATFVWANFIRLIYLSCVQDIALALDIAKESESHKQVISSRLWDLRAKFEQFRFDTEMWRLQPHTQEERQRLAGETQRQAAEARVLISTSRQEFGTKEQTKRDWLEKIFVKPSTGVLQHWDELETSILMDTIYLPVSRDELTQIVRAFDFGYTGHWYTCKNGHIYTITECGGAMERSVCPECGSPIGGTDHTLVEANQPATEMENISKEQGSQQSHWAWGR